MIGMQAERNRSQRKQQFVSRTIFHPSFKNVSLPDASEQLNKPGETSRWLFRPSNKGTHQSSITMKVRVQQRMSGMVLLIGWLIFTCAHVKRKVGNQSASTCFERHTAGFSSAPEGSQTMWPT